MILFYSDNRTFSSIIYFFLDTNHMPLTSLLEDTDQQQHELNYRISDLIDISFVLNFTRKQINYGH